MKYGDLPKFDFILKTLDIIAINENSFWEEEMKQNGDKNILTSTQSDEEAQYFYRKMGYKEIGGFKYFNDPYEIIFQKIF